VRTVLAKDHPIAAGDAVYNGIHPFGETDRHSRFEWISTPTSLRSWQLSRAQIPEAPMIPHHRRDATIHPCFHF
jgi:hypothetical protein